MNAIPHTFGDRAVFGLYATYQIPEFVRGGNLEFTCRRLDEDSLCQLYRIPRIQGTALPHNLRDEGTFSRELTPTPLTAVQSVRRHPPNNDATLTLDYSVEVCLQCFALNTALVDQARAENRVKFIHGIDPYPGENYTGQQWGAVDYYEKYPKPLYDIRYDGTPIALINADHYTLSDDGHHLTVHHDFFSWRVWINGTTQWIKDAFTISPPIFTLTAPGTITVTETHDMYIEKPLGWDEATEY